MDHASVSPLTLGESLIWVNYMFNATEGIAAAIPDELLDWRPAHAAGGFHFSLAEIVMHLADARRMFAAQLTGDDYSAEYYAPHYWANEDVSDEVAYSFKPYGTKQALIESLRQARELYAPFLALPASELGHVPVGSRRAFQRMLAEFQAAGQDIAAHERHGPGTVCHALLAVVAHESGHRGSLHTLLRLNGVLP